MAYAATMTLAWVMWVQLSGGAFMPWRTYTTEENCEAARAQYKPTTGTGVTVCWPRGQNLEAR